MTTAIQDVLTVIGIPSILAFIVWLVRLEASVKHQKTIIDDITKKLDLKLDSKFEIAIDRITDSISVLTTAVTKHDLLIENIKDSVRYSNEGIQSLRQRFDKIIEVKLKDD